MSRIRQRSSNSVLGRISRKLLAVLLLFGIPALLLISIFSIKKVEVVGGVRYTEEQIKELVFHTKPDNNSLYLYLKYRFFEEIDAPFLEKVEIDMTDSHSVTIYVYEKMVAGCVEFMGEYLYFDKDGIVVESSSERLDNIPLIKGLQYNKIILNEKLEVQKEELFDVILHLTQLVQKYNIEADAIRFNQQYEVTMDCGDIKVLLGKKATYDEALADLKNILAEAKGMEITLDMRNYTRDKGNVIAKPKKATE